MSKNWLTADNNLKNHSHELPRITRLLIYFYFILSFFEPYLNGLIGGITKYYIFGLMIIVALTAKKITFKTYHTFFLFWLVYKIITLVWTRDYTVFNMHIVSQIGMVALFCVLTAVNISGKTIDGIVKSLFLSSSLIGLLSVFFSEPYQDKFEQRLVLRLFGQETDPNNQAAFVTIGIAIGLYYLLVERRYRLVSLVVIAINFYSLTLTGSRGGFVTILAIVLAIIVLKSNRPLTKRKIKRVVIILLISVVLFAVVQALLPQNIFDRLFDFETYEGGSSRSAIWSNVWHLISQKLYLIFGAGWGSYYGYNGFYYAVHNTYLAMLCDVGLIGSILFFYPIITTSLYLYKKKDVLPLCLLVSGMVPSIFLDAINKRFFWNSIIMIFIVYNYWKENKRST